MRLLLLGIIFISNIGDAKPIGTIISFKGNVKHNKSTVSSIREIHNGDTIKTNADSQVVIQLKDIASNGLLNPGTEIKFEDDIAILNYGTVRWKSGKKRKSRLKVKTNGAVMGVRGTDFISTYTQLLDETEIVVFEGEVHLQNASKKRDSKIIKEGQWGGVGGRFGSDIGQVLDLPSKVLSTFSKQTEF